jgi:hypothetical protein
VSPAEKKQGMKLLARTFFNQLRTSGYTPNQIIEISAELLDLVSTGIRENDKRVPELSSSEKQDFRQAL